MTLERKITALPGRLAVLWPLEPQDGFSLVVPDWVKRRGEQLRGEAFEARRCKVLSSGFPGVYPGDSVGILADGACLTLEKEDWPEIPDGFEVRFYGVTEPLMGSDRDLLIWKD